MVSIGSGSVHVTSHPFQFYNGERWTEGGPGDFLYVPAGGLRAFQNDADEPLSMLMLFSPGAPREEYFEKAAEYAERNREELKAFQARHDTYFTDMPSHWIQPHARACQITDGPSALAQPIAKVMGLLPCGDCTRGAPPRRPVGL